MKVEHQKLFTPVIITLETEDELNYLWHVLNLNSMHVEKNTVSDVAFPRDARLVARTMWAHLDKIVRKEV